MINKIDEIVNEVKKVIVGKDEIIKKVVMAIMANGHILIEDVPGVGKTTLVLAFSKSMGLDYKRIQFTPDVMPSDVVGFSVYDKESNELVYKPGVVMTNLLLADEINRTSSKTQSALLEVMEEEKVTIDGKTYELPKPFIVISTQNPVGSAGTQLLPQSQLDRFMVKTKMGYPDFNSQVDILRDRQKQEPLDLIKNVLSKDDILSIREEVKNVHVSDEVLQYITNLVEETRKHEMVHLGVSPRGALALARMSKANAYMEGRDYVIPEDIIGVFSDVCGHRMILNPKAKMTNISSETICNEIIEEVPLPIKKL